MPTADYSPSYRTPEYFTRTHAKALRCLVLGREIWRPVINWEGYYEVSNFGRVKSLDREFVDSRGQRQRVKGKLLTRNNKSGGYVQVFLCHKGRVEQPLVHSVVLGAFFGPCPEGMECRHFPDRDRTNNRLDNLSWGTRKENQHDRIFHGTNYGSPGERHWNAKLTENEAQEVRRRACAGEDRFLLAEEFGINEATIRDIRDGKSWRHLGKEVAL